MKTETKTRPTRMSAGERREEILEAALTEFSVKGLHGTSTETIAERAGVSQPYLFRLFGTKKDLFLAVVARGFDRVQAAMQRGAEAKPEDILEGMGEAYIEMLAHRQDLLLQLQIYAACSDQEVQELVRRRYGELYRFVQDTSGAGEEELLHFFACGMLLNIAAAMDLPSLLNREEWALNLLGPLSVPSA